MVLISSCNRGFVSINRSKTGGNLGMMPKSFKTEPEPLYCLCMSSGSRYLATGGTDMVVKVWDLKQKTVLKQFTGHSDYLSSLTFSHNDRHITSSSDSGEILIHDVFTSEDLLSLTCKTGVNGLDYSRFYPALCCSGEKSGKVTLWDVEKRSIYHQFRRHEDECMDVSFSRINHMLLVTIGKGGRLVLYDVKDRKEVQMIYTGKPLQSLSFLEDGRHIACGTADGEVIMYDVNNTYRPLFVQKISKKSLPIRRLRFQKFERSALQRPEPPREEKRMEYPKRTVTEKAEGSGQDGGVPNIDGKVITKEPKPQKVESTREISFDNQTTTEEEEETEKVPKSFEKTNEQDQLKVSQEELQELINSTRPSNSTSQKSGFQEEEVEDDDEEDDDMEEPQKTNLLGQMSLEFSEIDGSINTKDDDSIEDLKNFESTASPIKKIMKKIPGDIKLVGHVEMPNIGEPFAVTNVQRSQPKRKKKKDDDDMEEGKIEGGPEMMKLMEQVNTKFDKFRESIHSDIQNLHIDVLRQFHLQQQEMASMIRNLTEKVEKVLAENEKLKEENYVFKNMY